jgi:hypothetical protein
MLIPRMQNLSVLYGADYFTEEEWIKLDSLLHKGRYVLSAGPPTNEADEEPLMTFDDSKGEIKDTVMETKGEVDNTVVEVKEEITESVVETPDDESFCQTRSDPMMDSDDQSLSSPVSQHGDSLPSRMKNTDETSADTSDEDSWPQPETTTEPTPESQAADSTVQSPEVQPQVEIEAPPQPETKTPQRSRYTQKQLDEVRAFNAGLTKAGHKTRPKYERAVEDFSEWNQDYDEPLREELAYPSPPSTEREARVDTWAHGVAKLTSLSPTFSYRVPHPRLPPQGCPCCLNTRRAVHQGSWTDAQVPE